jgi:hypothetical protein
MSTECTLLGHDDDGNLVYLVTRRNLSDPDDFQQWLDYDFAY